MKKILLLIIPVFFLTGCGGEKLNVNCNIDGKEAIFTLKDGIVSNYTLNNEKVSSSKIDEINGEYFTSATNNEEGREALETYINSISGTCQ